MTAPRTVHMTALLDACAVAVSPWPALSMDDPATKTEPIHVQVHLTRAYGSEPDAAGYPTHSMWRVVTRAVADSEHNTRQLLDDLTATLEGARLSIGGSQTGPIQFETETDIDADDAGHSGSIAWTYDHD